MSGAATVPPPDIGKKKATSNSIKPPPAAAAKPTSAEIPKAPSALPGGGGLNPANLPTPEQLQAGVQDKVNDRIAAAIVDSVTKERESTFDADYVNELYNPSLADVASGPAAAAPSAPAAKKKSAAAAPLSSAMPATPAATAQTASSLLVEKYGRYYNLRRAAHPTIRWVDPIQFARMREDDQKLLYNEIYVAENSKAISPHVLSEVLVHTAQYLSAISVIANQHGLLADDHTIGFDGEGRKSFYRIIKEQVDAGMFDEDFQQLWCEYAEYFRNAGPIWRLSSRLVGALGQSIQPKKEALPAAARPAPAAPANLAPPPSGAAEAAKKKFSDF